MTKVKQFVRDPRFWLVILTLSLFAIPFQFIQPVSAQGTSTATATVTQTPTNTPTPIATPLPMQVQSIGNPSSRCGDYGTTPLQIGDCFQAQGGGGFGIYSTTSSRVFAIDGSGNVTSTGTLSATNLTVPGTLKLGFTSTFTGPVHYGTQTGVTDGSTITHGFASAPTSCVVSPQWISGAAVTATIGGALGATTFPVKTSATITVTWMCGQ